MRPFLTAIKFYSKGMTTNSQHGTDPDDPDILRVLEIMEILDIPLCVHGEAAGYWLFREQNFHQYWLMWARRYPKLRIIMEHISDARTASLLSEHENLYATITPHHLLLTTDDFCGDMLRPHLFCKPLMKTPEDRERLRSIALNLANNDRDKYASTKVMLGTDSAAHDEANKLKDCGCAGVMNAPIALQLLAEEFHKYSTVEDFQNFVSDNAQRIYYLSHLPDRTITLRREPFKIPEKYGNVVPMWAGQEIPWTILATV
jgi:dihydroorotase